MSMRISESMKFNSILYNLNNLQSTNKTIMDQLSSQKKINRPSDDPTEIGKVYNIRYVQQMNDQYQKNIESSEAWLNMTEAKLSDLTDILISARELAIAQGTATATADTRRIAASTVDQMVGQMFNIANSQYLDRYIFAGSRSDQQPFSQEGFEGVTTDLKMAVVSGANNGFSGSTSAAIRSLRLANVVAGDTITIEGSTYTAVQSGAAAGQFNIGGTDADTADNLRAAIDAAQPGVYVLGGGGTADITMMLARKHQITAQGLAATTSLVGDAGGDFVIQVGGQGTITIADAAIDATTTLTDLQNLINSDLENAGLKAVTASIVDDGVGAGANRYRLVITAGNDGPDYEISILTNPTNLTFSSANTVELSDISTNSRAHFSLYTGDTNKTYAMKIVTGGSLADATYKISLDGGRTWGAEMTDLDAGIVDLGDGVVMRFAPGTFAVDDIFSVRASTPGFYDGDAEKASTDIGQGSPFAYAMSGDAVFTDKGTGQIDLFEVMKNLKTAMESNDVGGIQEQIDKLKEANDQVVLNSAISGTRMSRLEVAKNYQEDYNLRAAEMLSRIEDADTAKLATDLATTQLALEASYKVATMITQGTTILNFLK